MTTFMGKLVVMPACRMAEAKPQAKLVSLPIISFETKSVLGKLGFATLKLIWRAEIMDVVVSVPQQDWLWQMKMIT